MKNTLVEKLNAEGPYLRNILSGTPSDLDFACENLDKSFAYDEILALMQQDLHALPATWESLLRILRIHKRRHFVRIFARELLKMQPLRLLTKEIAAVAEASLNVALTFLSQHHQFPDLPEGCTIFGMGKLGGEELNYSSDIDLIVVTFLDDGNTELQYTATSIIQQLIRALETPTEDGFVFRVDMRLRPFGSQGPLLVDRAAFISYYHTFGRGWERAALLKMRPVAGNLELGEEILGQLTPFIFRKYLDYNAIDELKLIKLQIEDSLLLPHNPTPTNPATSAPSPHAPQTTAKSDRKRRIERLRRGRHRKAALPPDSSSLKPQDLPPNASNSDLPLLGWNLKTGFGGIREVEFFVQALQLVHGGKQAELRQHNTLQSLDNLRSFGFISALHHAQMNDAYDLFRRVEHRLQMENNQQLHTLPNTFEAFEDLALRLDFPSAHHLSQALLDSQQKVHTLFDSLFSQSERQPDSPTVAAPCHTDRLIRQALECSYLSPEQLTALSLAGFSKPQQVAGQLHTLQQRINSPFHHQAPLREVQLTFYLMECAVQTPHPDMAMTHLTNLFHSMNNLASVTRVLLQNPHASRLIVQIFGSSRPLSRTLINNPNNVVNLLHATHFRPKRSKKDLQQLILQRMELATDHHHALNLLKELHSQEVLRIALHLLGGTNTLSTTTSELSNLADAVLAQITTLTIAFYVKKHDLPPSIQTALLTAPPFTLLAVGKLGGSEISFGSDLDLVFITDETSLIPEELFTQLAKRIFRTLSTDFYHVDTRLRPSGNQGTLVVSHAAFVHYHQHHSQLWERQALLRARPILGCSEFQRKVRASCQTLSVAKPHEQIIESIGEMRNRVLENSRSMSTKAYPINLKTTPGGILDIEFYVQMKQLQFKQHRSSQHAHPFIGVIPPQLSQSTTEALSIFHPQLRDDYLRLREIESYQTIIESTDPSNPNESPLRMLSFIARLAGFPSEDRTDRFLESLHRLLDHSSRICNWDALPPHHP